MQCADLGDAGTGVFFVVDRLKKADESRPFNLGLGLYRALNGFVARGSGIVWCHLLRISSWLRAGTPLVIVRRTLFFR